MLTIKPEQGFIFSEALEGRINIAAEFISHLDGKFPHLPELARSLATAYGIDEAADNNEPLTSILNFGHDIAFLWHNYDELLTENQRQVGAQFSQDLLLGMGGLHGQSSELPTQTYELTDLVARDLFLKARSSIHLMLGAGR